MNLTSDFQWSLMMRNNLEPIFTQHLIFSSEIVFYLFWIQKPLKLFVLFVKYISMRAVQKFLFCSISLLTKLWIQIFTSFKEESQNFIIQNSSLSSMNYRNIFDNCRILNIYHLASFPTNFSFMLALFPVALPVMISGFLVPRTIPFNKLWRDFSVYENQPKLF